MRMKIVTASMKNKKVKRLIPEKKELKKNNSNLPIKKGVKLNIEEDSNFDNDFESF